MQDYNRVNPYSWAVNWPPVPWALGECLVLVYSLQVTLSSGLSLILHLKTRIWLVHRQPLSMRPFILTEVTLLPVLQVWRFISLWWNTSDLMSSCWTWKDPSLLPSSMWDFTLLVLSFPLIPLLTFFIICDLGECKLKMLPLWECYSVTGSGADGRALVNLIDYSKADIWKNCFLSLFSLGKLWCYLRKQFRKFLKVRVGSILEGCFWSSHEFSPL